jgi:integrase
MKGTVIKRGGTYSVVVERERDPLTGKRKREWHSGFRTKRDAEEARVRILAGIQRGEHVEPSRMTVAEFLVGEWLPAVRASVAPSTYGMFERSVRNHLAPGIGRLPVQRLTAAHVNALYGELLDTLAQSTVRQHHAVLHRALADAVRWGYVVRNVADSATAPRPPKSEKLKTWTAAELRTFLGGVSDDRLYALWHLLATTGARRAEAAGADWRDVDLDAGTWQVGTSKTARGRRSIALDAGTVAVLRAHRKRQLEERLAWGPAYTDSGRVFTRENGAPVEPHNVTHMFAGLVRKSGLPYISVHGLRHTWATLALSAGVHPVVVQERLGHSSVKVTLDTYSHAVPAMQADAAATVASLIAV